MKIKKLFTVLLALTLFTAGYAQMPDKTKLDQFFNRLAEKNKAMGNLVVAKGGNVLYSRAIGYSQINGIERKPVSATTKFRVGSITKMFTAALVLQLVEEGKLKLTDTLDKFLPQIPNASKITVAHILAHRSGIHDVTEDRNLRPSRLKPITKDEYIAIIVKARLILSRMQNIPTAIPGM
jgi:CubicO group peptidase (beta-lactamase class C family)